MNIKEAMKNTGKNVGVLVAGMTMWLLASYVGTVVLFLVASFLVLFVAYFIT